MPRAAHLLTAALVAAVTAVPAPARAADPLVGEQWHLQAIGAPDAWPRTTGARTLVAVVDSGLELGAPEFAGRLWVNPGEVPGNGADDDGNGVVDDVHGADFIDGDGRPDDRNGHGTHVAGVIAAASDGRGVAGVAPGARLMAVRVLDAEMAGDSDGLARGIRYAVRMGADVLNVSVNGDGSEPAVDEALEEARARGVLVVASAGNQGRDIDRDPSFPASSALPNVLAVGSTGPAGLLSAFSNRGTGAVDLAAPGERVLSIGRDRALELRTGTSAAAPQVTGAVALLHDARPDLDAAALREVLVATARRADGLLGRIGSGVLDVRAALDRVLGTARPVATSSTTVRPVRRKAAAPARCAKGKVRKAGRCVKKARPRAAAKRSTRAPRGSRAARTRQR